MIMPTLNESNFAPPKSWMEFEDMCLSMAKIRWESADCYRHGRPGQPQQGVDIYAYTTCGLVGIQCKLTAKEALSNGLRKLINDAEKFSPPLDAFYVAVATPHDSHLQHEIRAITLARQAEGKFPVEILFWEDITSDLARNPSVLFQHFPYLTYRIPQDSLHMKGPKPTFSIDELGVTRQLALNGFSVRITSFVKFGVWTGSVCVTSILLSHLFSQLTFPVPGFLTLLVLGLGMTSLAIAGAMKNKKFEHFLFRRFYLEASQGGRVYISSFTAVCPWCNSHMRLWNVGAKGGPRDDIFICTRNSRQHTVLLDPTALPEITDAE